jgi:hypothetical protein
VMLALGLAGAALVPARADAAELAARGPRECPDAAEVTFRVERLLGMPLIRAAVLHFDLEFAAAPNGYEVRLLVSGGETTGSPKQRELRAKTCGEVADAVSIAIALALGARAAEPEALAEPAASPRNETASAGRPAVSSPEIDETPPPAADAVAPQRAAFTPALLLAMLFDTGSLPAPGLGVALGAELRSDRYALRALISFVFEQHASLPGSGSARPGADLSLALGSLEACAAPFGSLRANLALALCGGWELGRLTGTGTGVSRPHEGSQLWSAARIAAGLGWTVPGTALRLGTLLTLAAPLERNDFVLRDLGLVYRPPSLVGRWAVGIDVSFD